MHTLIEAGLGRVRGLGHNVQDARAGIDDGRSGHTDFGPDVAVPPAGQCVGYAGLAGRGAVSGVDQTRLPKL
jgi:hypothetical protein